jgi:hypothetical protein
MTGHHEKAEEGVGKGNAACRRNAQLRLREKSRAHAYANKGIPIVYMSHSPPPP